MQEYLVGLMYHYSKDYKLWQAGHIEDYEASTGIFIGAENTEAALRWSRVISSKLLNYVNNTDSINLEDFQHENWIEPNPEESNWNHCLEFFQHVVDGELPNLELMTADAYAAWCDNR